MSCTLRGTTRKGEVICYKSVGSIMWLLVIGLSPKGYSFMFREGQRDYFGKKYVRGCGCFADKSSSVK